MMRRAPARTRFTARAATAPFLDAHAAPPWAPRAARPSAHLPPRAHAHRVPPRDQGGEDGFLSLREALPENFDRAAIEAVLAEWFKTLADLPAGLRMAVEMVRLLARAMRGGVRARAGRATRSGGGATRPRKP